MTAAPKISGVRIHKLTNKIDDVIDEFVQKNKLTSNEEVHLALHRIYQMHELQTIIMLTKAFQEKNGDEKPDYIK